MRGEVHPVAQRRDERAVRQGEEREVRLEGQVLVVIDDRRIRELTKLAINTRHQVLHSRLDYKKRPSLELYEDHMTLSCFEFAIDSRRRRDLDEHRAADPLWVGRQEGLKGEQLVRDPLDAVQLVARDNHLHSVVAPAHLGEQRSHIGRIPGEGKDKRNVAKCQYSK